MQHSVYKADKQILSHRATADNTDVRFPPIADTSEKRQYQAMSLIRDLSLATAIGLLVSITANGCKLAFTDYTPEADEWLAYAVMSAFPFAMLAMKRFSGRTEWLLVALLTAGVWGTYLLLGIPQLATRGSTDMALGIIVGTSWIWITAAVLVAGLLSRAFRRAS